MALTSSGQIKVSEINTELGRTSTSSNTSVKNLNTGAHVTINSNSTSKPNSSAPHQMSEFYSYNHSASGATLTQIVFYYSSEEGEKCGEDTTSTVYYDNSDEIDVDVQLYSDSSGGESAAGGYYKYVFSSSGWVVNEDGEITDSFSCGRSERRLKYNIEFIGDSPMGIPMYHFNYKDESHGKGRFVGTMVDDLQRLGFEDSLFEQNGEIWVNYHKLDVPFESVTN
jgi:hypothetical protein